MGEWRDLGDESWERDGWLVTVDATDGATLVGHVDDLAPPMATAASPQEVMAEIDRRGTPEREAA